MKTKIKKIQKKPKKVLQITLNRQDVIDLDRPYFMIEEIEPHIEMDQLYKFSMTVNQKQLKLIREIIDEIEINRAEVILQDEN